MATADGMEHFSGFKEVSHTGCGYSGLDNDAN